MKPGSTVAGNTNDGILKWRGGGSFEGTVRLSNGRFDRRRFLVENDAKRITSARREWEEWKAEVRQEERKKMHDRAQGKEREHVTKLPPREVRKDMTTPKTSKTSTPSADKVYVVMVVGGAPVFVVDDFEHAASVCDALTAGAEASGFAAKYDVVEVKRWTV